MATNVRLEFNNLPAVLKKTDGVLNKGMAAATLEAHKIVTKAISRTQDTRRTSGGALVGLNPSKPGTYPKVVTRRLIQDLGFDVKKTYGVIRGRVISSTEYTRYLEFGGRSFLRRGIKNNLTKIGKAFIRGAV